MVRACKGGSRARSVKRCRVFDAGMTARYSFFVLEVVKAWVDPARKDPRTLHHRGRGSFMVAGETIKLPSRMK